MAGEIASSKVMPLDERSAIQLGCEMVSEGVVFGLCLAALWFEYSRSQTKDKAKEKARAKELNDRDEMLTNRIIQLEQRCSSLEARLAAAGVSVSSSPTQGVTASA
eukprot:TRINITY_DN2523_c0_g2_i3.p1 TRINITY_DN2523_c0_g2~~TRINITY_DN2523_c0_g2_i3.p1  ORF type:complete len:118 (+),score=43.18 TRINITY_DN2523_c0_g2_i3:37-354(+)